ncbi:MAG: methyltransferase [Pirellulales bacterium]
MTRIADWLLNRAADRQIILGVKNAHRDPPLALGPLAPSFARGRPQEFIDTTGLARSSSLAFVAFVAAVAVLAGLAHSAALAVYSLSFWHYYLYWLAYRYGAAPLPVFKREAVLLKGAALGAWAFAYVSSGPELFSLLAMAAGFSLNASAARVLGSDRTYYGHELADLPLRRITAFPYSWTAHPMLLGNVLAFGGSLLNGPFRQQWWPLAVGHVALNVALLVMEVAVKPLRLRARCTHSDRNSTSPSEPRLAINVTSAAFVIAGAALAGALVAWRAPAGAAAEFARVALIAAVSAAFAGFALILFGCYSLPWPWPGTSREDA